MLLLNFLGEYPVGYVGWCAVSCFHWSEPHQPDSNIFGVNFKRELSLDGNSLISKKRSMVKCVKLTREKDGVHADFSMCENTRIREGKGKCNQMGAIVVDYKGLVFGPAS